MIKIVGISGSLRAASYNTALLQVAAETVKDIVEFEVVTINDIPLYNEDVENSDGIPQSVITLQEKVATADGVLIATPEYNHSIPGVLKNAIDWLSRPPKEIPRIFSNRPVAVVGATMGGLGTALSQAAWLPVLRRLNMRPWFGGQIMISKAHNVFDESGKIIDETVQTHLKQFLDGFINFVESNNTKKHTKNIN